MNPPMKPLAPGLPLPPGLAVELGSGVACSGVAVIGGGAGVGTGVGGAVVGATVGRGVAPDVTVTVGPAIVSSLRSATAVNVTGQVPTGKVLVPPNVPFVLVPEITPIWTVRPATDAVTVAAKPS
jgi:hypothetical protein